MKNYNKKATDLLTDALPETGFSEDAVRVSLESQLKKIFNVDFKLDLMVHNRTTPITFESNDIAKLVNIKYLVEKLALVGEGYILSNKISFHISWERDNKQDKFPVAYVDMAFDGKILNSKISQ